MPTQAQMGGAAAVAVAAALGSYAIYSFTTSEGEKLDAVYFKKGFDFSNSTDYKDKLLSLIKKDNLEFLVVPIPEEKDKQEIQKKWWDWAFKKKYENNKKEDSLDTIFKGIKKGFSDKENDTESALNQACKKAYKQDKNTYKFTDSNLLKNISDFCTKVEGTFDISEPISNTYQKNDGNEPEYKWGVLSFEDNKTNLVKAKEIKNDLWWKWAYEKLFKGSKNKYTSFSEVDSGYKSSTDNWDKKSLNYACNEAYKKPKKELENSANHLLENIKKFCTPSKNFVPLNLPTDPATPKFLSSNQQKQTNYTKGVGKESKNQEHLVDPDENQNWWEWAYENFYKLKGTSFTLDEEFFKKTEKVEKGYGANEGDKALNQACKKAYKKEKNGDDAKFKTLLENIKQFCTKDQKQTIIEPTN